MSLTALLSPKQNASGTACIAQLPEFHPSSSGPEDTFLQLIGYFQRLAVNETSSMSCNIVVLPSPNHMANTLNVDTDDIVSVLGVLRELGYHCEVASKSDPVFLSDYLAAA